MIKVINPGFFTTVQDFGRWGYQAFGMPVAGAMDRVAYKTANLLLGNQENAAALELTLLGGEYEFLVDTHMAITGADMEPLLNGKPLKNWSAAQVKTGDVLSLGFVKSGCRAYLAVAGGFDVPLILGSRATHTRSKIGGFEGRNLKKDDCIKVLTECAKANIYPVELSDELILKQNSDIILRVILGPQDSDFTESGITTLFSETYTITNEADRMGYRLDGAVIEHSTKPDIVSDALCQGAIQIPGHGKPIVMMADRQTTGGYTKIGSVISADLRLLAQAKPGDVVRFAKVDDEQAVLALKAEEEFYRAVNEFLAKQQYANQGKNYNIIINNKQYMVNIQEKN